jgi:hypothetical protein
VTTACGVVIGLLLGTGMSGGYTHGRWAIIAGLVMGVIGALAARSYRVLVALGGGSVVVLASVVIIVLHQRRLGYWPITDETTIELYGTGMMATVRIAMVLWCLVCVPCGIAAAVTAFAKRRES